MTRSELMSKISVAPMVDRTTKEFRNFFRMFNSSSELYTEMITDRAILNGDLDRILKFNEIEKKICLQIATCDPKYAKEAVKIANRYDYDSININAGCPSDRIADNKMGACLMSDANLIVDIVEAMKEVTDKPITLKHRIGIDGTGLLEDNKIMDSYDELLEFVDTVSKSGVNKYIIHSRIAILKGLSPSQNRTIPPINYERVYKLKEQRPNLDIEINGGIKTLEDALTHLEKVDSCMIGRAAYDNPMLLNEFEISREEIIEKLITYIENNKDVKPYHVTMHTLGLFYNTRYSKIWKNVASNSKISSKELKEFLKEYESMK